jgi:predicted enzyme related to lactoylglutathione lyase
LEVVMISASTYGAPNWVDLATTDVVAAKGFYRDLLGWEIEKTTSPMGDYYLGGPGESQVGGMMAIPPGEQMPPMWTVFIYVEDVDDTAARTREAGGSVLEEPFDIPDGRVAVIADPGGGMLGIIAGPAPDGIGLSTAAGNVCWVELLTRDLPAAESFYGEMFGWKAETRLYGDIAYTSFMLEGEAVAGMMAMPAELGDEVPPHWSVYFAADDCAKAAETVGELGGMVLRPPQETEIGHFAVLQDPQGAVFSVMDYNVPR